MYGNQFFINKKVVDIKGDQFFINKKVVDINEI